MKAKYNGKCGKCGQEFYAGAEIERIEGTRWRAVDCKGCLKNEIFRRIRQPMIELGFSYGLWDGDKIEYPHLCASPQEYFTHALVESLITEDEYRLIHGVYGYRFIKDLFD